MERLPRRRLRMIQPNLLIVVMMAAGCASNVAHQANQFCGESFCLSSVAADNVQTSSPVEDFHLYRVTMGTRTYQIYEGNQPMRPGRLLRAIRTHIPGARAAIYRGEETIEARIDRGLPQTPIPLNAPTPLPQYVVAYAVCPQNEDCGIEEFVGPIVPR